MLLIVWELNQNSPKRATSEDTVEQFYWNFRSGDFFVVVLDKTAHNETPLMRELQEGEIAVGAAKSATET